VPVTHSFTAFGRELNNFNLWINLISVFQTLFYLKIQMWQQVGFVDLYPGTIEDAHKKKSDHMAVTGRYGF